jgi:DNA-binding MarR family transcriptional regulator
MTKYRLDDQVGFVLRQAQQRHAAIFADTMIEGLTPTQWAALAKLAEVGPCSQNQLGRLTAMDSATIKGVIDRLTARGLTRAAADADDARRLAVDLTPHGAEVYARGEAAAQEITAQTLAPLDGDERRLT